MKIMVSCSIRFFAVVSYVVSSCSVYLSAFNIENGLFIFSRFSVVMIFIHILYSHFVFSFFSVIMMHLCIVFLVLYYCFCFPQQYSLSSCCCQSIRYKFIMRMSLIYADVYISLYTIRKIHIYMYIYVVWRKNVLIITMYLIKSLAHCIHNGR